MRSNRGYTLIEALLSAALLFVVVVLAGYTFILSQGRQTFLEKDLSFFMARNQVISYLVNDKGWTQTIESASNAEMDCIKKIKTSTSASDLNCTGKTDKLTLLNIKSETLYDFKQANLGFAADGSSCQTYVTPPTAGDPNCPLHLDLSWTPVCAPASNCAYPLLKFVGNFSFNSPGKPLTALQAMAIEVYKSQTYCADINATSFEDNGTPVSLTLTGAQTVLTDGKISNSLESGSIFSTEAGPIVAPLQGLARTTAFIYPCHNMEFIFLDNMQIPSSFSGAYTAADAGNRAEVCLANEAGVCVYKFTRFFQGSSYTYTLSYNGVVVMNKPSWLTINSTSQFKFSVNNGLVRFCASGASTPFQCFHLFEEPLDFRYRVTVSPAGANYSAAGLTVVSLRVY